MASACELRLQEDRKAVLCDFFPDHARAERQDVGVIVLSRQPCGRTVVAERRAHAPVTIGGNGDADPRAAHQHSLLGTALVDSLCHGIGKVGIVNRITAVGSEAQDIVTLAAKMICKTLLKGEAGMVGCQRNCPLRSEERRVGKECGAVWWGDE